MTPTLLNAWAINNSRQHGNSFLNVCNFHNIILLLIWSFNMIKLNKQPCSQSILVKHTELIGDRTLSLLAL